MRLGEIKNILDYVVSNDHVIVVQQEQLYGGQVYRVDNFQEIVEAFDAINTLSWNDVGDEAMSAIIEKYRKVSNPVQLEQVEYGDFSSYINAVNAKLPFFYAVLDTMVEDQDEKVINIKLPDQTDSLTELTEVNKRLDKLFKIFSSDGQFEFKGFDTGSMWYVVMTVGFASYQFLIHGLDIAKRFFETREKYYKSKTAELDYKASLDDETKFTEKGLEKYKERRLKLMVEEEVKNATEKLKVLNGRQEKERVNQMILGVQAIVKELESGTEFHLSLNQPEYVTGSIGRLKINYKKVQEIRETQTQELEEKKGKELPAAIEENASAEPVKEEK